jgi:hypothetical protein
MWAPTPPGNLHGCDKKGVARQESGGQAGKGIRKVMKTKERQKSKRNNNAETQRAQSRRRDENETDEVPPTPGVLEKEAASC